MRFFKDLFQKPASEVSKNLPDNTKLFALIEQYISDNEYESYKKVVLELEQGNSYLLLPSEHELVNEFSTWTLSPAGLKVNIGIWFVDGLKATAAFTREEALFEWAKKPAKYFSFRSQTVLELCEANGIDRIVIDSKLRTMIVLQKNH
jgi:hypothetical protein